jgi:hypothetical protein
MRARIGAYYRHGGADATGPMSWARWEDRDEEAVRRFVEGITHRIDPAAHVLLREPGRPVDPHSVRFALLQSGHAVPFELSEAEWSDAHSAVGRERLARRIGAALGLQPPDQMTGPPRD